MFIAILLLVTKGVSSDNQKSLLSRIFTNNYIEETAAAGYSNGQDQNFNLDNIYVSPTNNSAPKTSVLNTVQGNSLVSRSTILTDILDQFSDKANQISTYTVQEGDTLSFIASDFGVSVDTIIWANNLKNANDISPGTDLKIPPITGVIHKVKSGDTVSSIAKIYGVEADKIIAYNSLPQEGDLSIGDELIIPGGRLPSQTKSTPAQQSNLARKFSYLPNLNSFFLIPTTGYDWGIIHGRNGVDIANSCGTTIYASADGNVTTAKANGYNGGFGKYIKISHSNGTETLYAHASKILVDVGQFVSRGQEIALMGTTGHSTGCHLHFEVHGAKNPLAK